MYNMGPSLLNMGLRSAAFDVRNSEIKDADAHGYAASQDFTDSRKPETPQTLNALNPNTLHTLNPFLASLQHGFKIVHVTTFCEKVA